MDVYNTCDALLNELSLFANTIAEFGPPINDNRLELFEDEISFTLPLDFKYVLKKYNGISIMGTGILGLDKSLRRSSLNEVYQFEHFETAHPMPVHFLPFSPDGRGNHYCLNLMQVNDGICPVVFWQWDYNYSTVNEVEQCYSNFTDWIKEVMIEWTLEDHNYDGTSK
ncbi:MAG: SMI1/KNR4 family protein [Mucilaginibacter sp.]